MKSELTSILAITTSHRLGSLCLWSSAGTPGSGQSGVELPGLEQSGNRTGPQDETFLVENLLGQATESLHPALESLLQRRRKHAGCERWEWKDLGGIVWDGGPGSFTGLRAAQSFVRGFAYLHSTPVLQTDSFTLQARSLPSGRWILCMNAYQQTVFVSRVENQKPLDPILNFSVGQVPEEYFAFSKNWAGDGVSLIQKSHPEKVLMGEDIRPNAKELVEIARASNFSQWTKDWKTVTPLYLRGSAAEELRAKG